MSIHAPDAPSAASETPRRRSWLPWLVAAAVALTFAGVLVGVLASRDDQPSTNDALLGAQQVASIRQACAQWQADNPGSAAPSAAWCDDMAGWMTDRIANGPMMGSMMWSHPEQLVATCQRWMSSSEWADNSPPDTSTWCGRMVDWMTRHIGNWDDWDRGWMMNGPVMGG
jgi:hypothetical protein